MLAPHLVVEAQKVLTAQIMSLQGIYLLFRKEKPPKPRKYKTGSGTGAVDLKPYLQVNTMAVSNIPVEPS